MMLLGAAARKGESEMQGHPPLARTLSTHQVVARCFVCATPLRRNSWRWTADHLARVCRDRRACQWRNDHGVVDTIVA